MLYKRPDSQIWWVTYTDPLGKSHRKSTKTADREQAEVFASNIKLTLWKQTQMGERIQHSWEEAANRWLAETTHKASRRDDIIHLRWLATHLSSLPLSSINREVIDRVKQAKVASKVSPASTNRTLALLRAILRRAERDWEWIDHAPSVRLLPEPKRRIRWLTHEEATRLISELPKHLAVLARFTLETGLRSYNATHLTWSQVDMSRETAWIHPDQAKARRAIGVPLSASALEILTAQQGQHKVWVFPYNDKPILQPSTRAWRNALARAKITNFRWHDLRHTWASWHIQSGTPLHVLQELGGWESPEMVQRYAHLSTQHLARYVSRFSHGTF